MAQEALQAAVNRLRAPNPANNIPATNDIRPLAAEDYPFPGVIKRPAHEFVFTPDNVGRLSGMRLLGTPKYGTGYHIADDEKEIIPMINPRWAHKERERVRKILEQKPSRKDPAIYPPDILRCEGLSPAHLDILNVTGKGIYTLFLTQDNWETGLTTLRRIGLGISGRVGTLRVALMACEPVVRSLVRDLPRVLRNMGFTSQQVDFKVVTIEMYGGADENLERQLKRELEQSMAFLSGSTYIGGVSVNWGSTEEALPAHT